MENTRKRVVVCSSNRYRVIVNHATSFKRVQERTCKAFQVDVPSFLFKFGEKEDPYVVFDDESLADVVDMASDENVVLFVEGFESAEPLPQKKMMMMDQPIIASQGISDSQVTGSLVEVQEESCDISIYCLHNLRCLLLTARTQSNYGKQFYKCPNEDGSALLWPSRCKAFKWKSEVDEIVIPYCQCGIPCRISYIEKTRNSKHGEWYYTCGKVLGVCAFKDQVQTLDNPTA
jgi:hypothetical protein